MAENRGGGETKLWHQMLISKKQWKCGYCRKSFNEEKFLGQHFATRHYNLLNTVNELLRHSSMPLVFFLPKFNF
uniref:C2H2-type domain-containing protein n=1 Tax=Brassica oleracea TaxID=3712 RepID=A0A3P6AY38_BRAOL|nr:unnamed protein product [Brassica oleracea]